jgi:hypothetical protein
MLDTCRIGVYTGNDGCAEKFHELEESHTMGTSQLTDENKVKLRYTYEMDGDFFVGYLDDYPEYPTQGENFKDFEENLLDIYEMIQDGTLDVRQKHGVLEIAV